ncbi:hypothetical protein KOR42_44530 [Thalassoglobus neptunius]|uniref:TPM domain-containing protein n=2 Tax=Thalassoglobus neptunius TaxID=1938619 RepID=A0A5C5W048_9PLAN|nr:hypothetical protein KOR42_44530 [Thalassoglobus neptunius]
MQYCYVVLLLLVRCACVFIQSATCEAQNSVPSVEALCDQISSVSIVVNPELQADDEIQAEIAAWTVANYKMHEIFVSAIHSNADNYENFINSYLDEALSRNGRDGFKLLLAAEGVLFSIQASARIHSVESSGETWVKCSRASAAHQMKLISSDIDKRSAIFQFIAWRGRNFNSNLMTLAVSNTVDHIRRKEDIDWNGRNFALLAIATNREDLVIGLPPGNLEVRCSEWAKWLTLFSSTRKPSSIGPFWYSDSRSPKSSIEDPWANDVDLQGLLVLPNTPLPGWTGELLKFKGSELPSHG